MKALDFLIYRARYTAEIVGPVVLLLLSALFLITRIELLMQHRDRVRHTSAWPIDLSIAFRLILFIIIPPLAWLGAAFVELGLDKILTGS